MSKIEIERLSKRVEYLEKEMCGLSSLLENNKLDKHIYTVAQTAQLLGVTPQAIYAMIYRKELTTIKIGRLKIPAHEVKRVLGYRGIA